jgi:hypothetical protein
VKTTIEVPDELYRRAKSEAALRGVKVRDLVEEGLKLALETRHHGRHGRLADLTRSVRGMIDSGVPDLGSNPDHLADLGRDGGRDR